MDLVAVAPSVPDADHFHANWTGWGVLGDLLVELGCDVSKMAGSNDGDVVDAHTAVAWAEAIESGLDRIFVEEVTDSGFVGGKSTRLRVSATDTPVPESSSSYTRRAVRNFMAEQKGEPLPEDVPSEVVAVVPLRSAPTDLDWVLSFARFCRFSGGFRQY